MFDLVHDGTNRDELVKTAKKLGFSTLYLLQKNPLFLRDKGITLKSARQVTPQEFSHLARHAKQATLVAYGTRAAFENKHISFILPLLDAPQDHTHYRRGGMDQIHAKLARDKHKTILFDFSALLTAPRPAHLLGRMRQNARLCKKYGVSFQAISLAKKPLDMRAANDLESFVRTLT